MNPVLKAKRDAKKFAKLNGIQLKQAQKQLAFQNGYDDWESYKKRIDTFWYRKSSPFLTEWFTSHDEAKSFQSKNSGYLLTYRGQFFVVEREYISHIGYDPDDPVWEVIDFDVSSNNAIEKFFKYHGKRKG